MIKSNRLPVTACLSVWLCLISLISSFGADGGTRLVLKGQRPAAAASLRAIDAAAPPARLNVTIALPMKDQAGLDALLKQIYDPGSPNYHHYLTPAQFAEKFGPATADYEALVQFAQKNGLTVTHRHANRLILDVTGPVAAIESTFQVKLKVYQHPKEARTFYAPDTEPSVDASLPFHVLSVSGLDNYALPRPASLHVTPPGQPGGVSPQTGSGPSGQYVGRDFRLAYVPGTKLNGTGQSVALLEYDGYYSNDITAYETFASLPAVTLTNVPVNGGVSSPGDADDEVSLDIEMAIAMATNLTKVMVYEAPIGTAWASILGQMADDDQAAQISCSWVYNSGPPDPSSEQIFQQMAAQGQSFFTSSGDFDAYTGEVSFPDDSPHITIVGGTTLTTASRGGTRVSEAVWNVGLDATSGDYVGTGGGVSTSYSIPVWQQGINSFLTNGGSTTARNIPDVALTAENIYIKFGNGQSETLGGTSCAAPLWAGFMALVNQQAAAAGQPTVGFINPAVYEIANESIYSLAFNDITTGNNAWPSSPNLFFAVPGYDLCTGLGTPHGTNLINALVTPDPLTIVPDGGFSAVGTPAGTFNIVSQTYYLTNAGASSLTWSLINTSAWLSVSNTGGVLAAGASDQAVISLNLVASNFNAGLYSAKLWFSNATTSVGHSRFFTLTTSDPLVITAETNLFFTGPPGGLFIPSTGGFVLTNPSLNTVNWALNNTSVWFNLSPTSGTLTPGSQAAVTVYPSAGATNLSDGLYPVSFQVTNLASQFVQTVGAEISVGIILNGGFETGDLTGWSLIGNTFGDGTLYNGVVTTNSLDDNSGPTFIHSGNYGFFMGDVNLATLSQTIPTTPGQSYVLSFWLDNPETGAGQEFLVNWITSSTNIQIFGLTNPPVIAWTNVVLIVSATDTNATLQFAGENPPNGFGLDDISLDVLAPPLFTSQPTNVTVNLGASATFSGAVRGIAPIKYQWQKNGTNLTSSGNISGATSSLLKISTTVVTNSGSYSLVATNNYGAVTSSIVTLTVVVPPGISHVSVNPDGTFSLSLLGTPGFTYVLEASTNLVPATWYPVATNTLGSNGAWQFNDVSVTNTPQRYYRLMFVP